MRLEAARARLATHHSSAYGGMQRQRGGRNANGGGADGAAGQRAAAKQLLLSLLDGAFPGAQGGGGGGGRSRAPSGQQRAGEWACPCGFRTNRPSRDKCFSCLRPRDTAGAQYKGAGPKGAGKGGDRPVAAPARGARSGKGSEGRYDGPVGANGSRPLLGGRGQSPPRGGTEARTGGPNKGGAWGAVQGKASAKGSSMGEDTAAAGKGPGAQVHEPGGKARHEGGKGPGKWVRPQQVEDDEGYLLVQPRRVRCQGDVSGGTQPQAAVDNATWGRGDEGRAARPRWADEDDSDADDDAYMEDDRRDDDGGDPSEECTAAGSDPRELKAEYDELAKAVREMERQGRFAQHGSAIKALREARDRAEREWRGAKSPPPLPKRLARAEAKLGKARQALENARIALETFDEQADKQRAALLGRIDEAEAWHNWRQEQVDELHAEAGERAPCWRQPVETAGSEEVRERIREQFLPELQAVIEHVAGNPEVVDRLSVLAAGLAEAEGRLEANVSGSVQAFNMASDDVPTEDWDRDDDWPGGTGDQEDRDGGGEGSNTRAAGWKPEGQGRWTRAGAALQALQAPASGAPNSTNGSAGAGEPAEGRGSGGKGRTGDDVGESPAKSRKCGGDEEAQADARAAADRQRALELLHEQRAAEEAQVASFNQGQGGFGSQAALSAAAQKFVLEVQRAEARAGKCGVEAKHADGRQLLELTPMELAEWVRTQLGDEDEKL